LAYIVHYGILFLSFRINGDCSVSWGKQTSASVVLRQFVDELNELLRIGFVVNEHKITVKVKLFECDTQARSYIKGKNGF